MNGPVSKEPRATRKNVPGRQAATGSSTVSTVSAYANVGKDMNYNKNANNEPPKVSNSWPVLVAIRPRIDFNDELKFLF
jgi:hypothetical protein